MTFTLPPIVYTKPEQLAAVGRFKITLTYDHNQPPDRRFFWVAQADTVKTPDGVILHPYARIVGHERTRDRARRAVREALTAYALDALHRGAV